MQYPWLKASARVVEAIRSAYVETPGTTAAGLAKKFGVPAEDGIAAIVGGWLGIDGLTTNVPAPNLALARFINKDSIEAKLKMAVRIESDLLHGTIQSIALKRSRVMKRVRKGKRQLRFEEHLATYQPLVGASMRVASRAAALRRAAARCGAGATSAGQPCAPSAAPARAAP